MAFSGTSADLVKVMLIGQRHVEIRTPDKVKTVWSKSPGEVHFLALSQASTSETNADAYKQIPTSKKDEDK